MTFPGDMNADAKGLAAYSNELENVFQQLLTQGPKLQRQAAEMRVTEESSDGLVRATVGVRGELVDLELDPRLYQRPDSAKLAETIVQTAAAAATRARDDVIELFAPLVPPEQMRAHMDGDMDAITEQIWQQIRGER